MPADQNLERLMNEYGDAILRICLTARHTDEHIRILVTSLREVLDGALSDAPR